MTDKKFIAESVGAGIVITLISYFYNGTPSGLVGAVWYGFPLTWIRYLVVGPQYSPWALDAVGLIADIVIWSVVAAIVLFIAMKYGKHK
ncbi:MAG: hypothetical protein KGI04_02465 [Candidatus Micrarchaeota archaeon]|nr:hypothetical protein [Candidatus Micrarchaeota archaeon]